MCRRYPLHNQAIKILRGHTYIELDDIPRIIAYLAVYLGLRAIPSPRRRPLDGVTLDARALEESNDGRAPRTATVCRPDKLAERRGVRVGRPEEALPFDVDVEARRFGGSVELEKTGAAPAW